MMMQYHPEFSKQLLSPPTSALWSDGLARENSYPEISNLLKWYDPISLAQMNEVALLDRIDTKYVLNVSQLYGALTSLTEHYRVLDIDGIRLNPYRTLYFDTVDFTLYLHHHAGGRNRYKVRSRKYVDSHLSFLEVKCKTNEHRTVKSRIQTPGLVTQLTPKNSEFVKAHFPLNPKVLEPKLWNNFSRITLVSKHRPERLTLDINLQFCHNGRTIALPGIAIAEVKQDGLNHNSDFMQQMRSRNIRPTGFSKYCIGVSMLYENVKHNNFKPKLRLVKKLIGGNDYVH